MYSNSCPSPLSKPKASLYGLSKFLKAIPN